MTNSPAPLVFITGASSGIGQTLAERYYLEGYRLALVARRTEEIQNWAANKNLAAHRFAVYRADVAQANEIIAAAQTCIQNQGLPNIVIANAGISIGMDTAQREDLEVMANTFAVNNLGLAATFHPFIAPMIERGAGQLVGVASVAGIRGLPGHGAYCASKAAVISYCESLRGEMRAANPSRGISVITLVPGYVQTPLTQSNAYAMPFLMTAEEFALAAVAAIRKNRNYCVIPWQMGWVAKLLRILPNPLFDRLLSGRPRKKRLQAKTEAT